MALTSLNGKVSKLPSKSRSRMWRIVRASTWPPRPSRSTTSPTEMLSSARMNKPLMTSCTNFCEPKPMAMPMTPAPASSGVISMPICDSTIKPTITNKMTLTKVRINGKSVRARALCGSAASSRAA